MAFLVSDVLQPGVYDLITDLCVKTAQNASKCSSAIRDPPKALINKMRSHAFEIILKKTSKDIICSEGEPILDLLSYYLLLKTNVKNVAEHKRSTTLKRVIHQIRHTDFGDENDKIHNVLRMLVVLSDTVKEDYSAELFHNPFSFGLLDEMLPKPQREVFGSPQPYSYYPSHVFELPYSLKSREGLLEKKDSQAYTEYTVESFESRSFLPDTFSQKHGSAEAKNFLSPMSFASMASTHLSPFSEGSAWNIPRLTGPRDLQIPSSKVKVSLPSTDQLPVVEEVFRAKSDDDMDIWEIATQLDKDVPDDIWEVVSKMPPLNERQLIATSPREMTLWRRLYENQLSHLSVVPEKIFIRHIMYLIIGVETNSFPFNEESKSFYMKDDLVLEGISKEHLQGYVTDLLLIGTYYKRLYKFGFNHCLEDHFHSNGLIYEAAREVIRRYLLKFRLKATDIYEECCKASNEHLDCMPTLLQILFHLEPLKHEIETVVSIYQLNTRELKTALPHGAELMSYLFNEISLVTHHKTALTMFNFLFSICKIYFKFIERFIFEGELDDKYNEFFIRKDAQYVNARSKRYWDKGFHITQSFAVPEFLRPLAKFILLCGKSLRLLKHCNPSDPLVLLISSDHPSVKSCASFEELEHQQQVLDVYRTRCLFVSGEPVTFEQIVLKREAERKAFAEIASIKQAETMEKIVAERKRLAQLIIAEKQHSLRVLELAMAEAKAAKQRVKHHEKKRTELESEAEKAREEVDSRLRDSERNKIMEYYTRLNMEVEKSKMHTEWKIKRLQLDQTRMQLLSSEERNLKREKLELQHQRNEEIMSMSIDNKSEDELDNEENRPQEIEEIKSLESNMSLSVTETSKNSELETKAEDKPHSSVFSAICNIARSVLGVTKSNEDDDCDNKKILDAQGNVITVDTENNSNKDLKSSDVIGADLDNSTDHRQFMTLKNEALRIKKKVMAHEFGTDSENNEVRQPVTSVDEENNIEQWSAATVEAKKNKLKVLGADFDQPDIKRVVAEPRTEAQKEALLNRQKVLGVEYNLPAEAIHKKEIANVAQEEALLNRLKVLGVEYNLPPEAIHKKEIANVAQEEAFQNRQKMLGSDDVVPVPTGHRRDSFKRSGLTLNLKPFNEMVSGTNNRLTPNICAVTPGDFYGKLDLETPTTADVPLEAAITCDAFTPQNEDNEFTIKEIREQKSKEYINSEGFNFSILEEDATESVVIGDVTTDTSERTPNKKFDAELTGSRYPIFDLIDGSYNLDAFDPFGVKELKAYSKDHFTSRMDITTSPTSYTHPAVIMQEVAKKPYANIFASHFGPDEEDNDVKCDNIATLTACLQRSVMLPLTYQLEVVNNSILTHFLVDLDMYEHLRSLKDYFFLMDGEFSKSICHNLFTRLVKTLNPQDLLNFATLHNILDKALGSSISHVHKFSENLSFTITECPMSFHHSSPDVLQCLSLTYAVSWPLNIILSQEALLRYARVFQFLVKMRRIFWVLGEDFATLKLAAKLSGEHSRKLQRSPQYITTQLYRHIMASMIRAIDNYIVTTCILTSWTEFETDLKKARTLDDLYDCHVVYIKKVLFRCLLNNRSTPVMKLLNDIFTVILKFSRLLKAGEWQQKEPNGFFVHTNFAQIEEVYHLFEKLAKYLHKVITKLMECGYQRHLVELLTMVNLNGYYDPKNKADNTTIMSP